MARRVSTSQSRGDPDHQPGINPEAPGHLTSIRLAASWGVALPRLQRPAIRAGSHARHLRRSASGDASRKAPRRRPHLYDGGLGQPGNCSGRLHQSPARGVTPQPASA